MFNVWVNDEVLRSSETGKPVLVADAAEAALRVDAAGFVGKCFYLEWQGE